MGAGYPTSIPHYIRSFPMPTRLKTHNLRNVEGHKVWREDGPTKGSCLWEMHGVWGWDKIQNHGVVLKESYFIKNPANGTPVSTVIPGVSIATHPILGGLVSRYVVSVLE